MATLNQQLQLDGVYWAIPGQSCIPVWILTGYRRRSVSPQSLVVKFLQSGIAFDITDSAVGIPTYKPRIARTVWLFDRKGTHKGTTLDSTSPAVVSLPRIPIAHTLPISGEYQLDTNNMPDNTSLSRTTLHAFLSHTKLAFRPAQAAEATGQSEAYIRRLIRKGIIKAKKSGTNTLITTSALIEWLEGLPDWAPEDVDKEAEVQ